MTKDAELRAFEALAGHARLSDLTTIARSVTTAAAHARSAAWAAPEKVKKQAEELKLKTDDAATPFGNALAVLERGPEDDAERALAAALYAHALASTPPKGRDDEDKVATSLLWLATHTPFDGLTLLDRALGDASGALWDAVADRIRRIDQRKPGAAPALGRGEALVGAFALVSSTSQVAKKAAAALTSDVRDPALARALARTPLDPDEARLSSKSNVARAAGAASGGHEAKPASGAQKGAPEKAAIDSMAPPASASHGLPPLIPPSSFGGATNDMASSAMSSNGARAEPTRLRGELATPPRGPVTTTVLALTGLLFVIHAVALFMRVALAFKRPSEVTMADEGVRVRSRTEILGRTLREREVVITRDALARATREVRYPRAAFYTGLLALALGSYVGMAFLVDGVRAASPSLILAGLAFAAVGIGLDFAFASLAPGAAGRCRVIFLPRRGRAICIAGVDATRADGALKKLVAPRG